METWQLRQMQSLPLEIKIQKSLLRIREWYEHWGGQVYVSFSGGKDSTVLLHLVRSIYPKVPAVFVDTGLEFPEIKEFVRTFDNVEILRPKMGFREILKRYGYPVVSKRQAQYISEIKIATGKNDACIRLRLTGINPSGLYSGSSKISNRWLYLKDAPFKISAACCEVMKKRPMGYYGKQTASQPFIGTMASDGANRELEFMKTGCNMFALKKPKSTPLGFWMEADIWEYIHTHNIPYSSIYDMGYHRTGCIFCAFGVHLEGEPNRFQRLATTHPKLYEYCIKHWEDGGLGLGMVLEYINVPYRIYDGQFSSEYKRLDGKLQEQLKMFSVERRSEEHASNRQS